MRTLALIALAFPLPALAQIEIDPARGAAIFAERCAACHGPEGRGGTGPDLTRIAARAGGAFPTVPVLAQIDGMGRHGDPDAVMPEFGAGDLGPTVIIEIEEGLGTPVPADLVALTEFLKLIQSGE